VIPSYKVTRHILGVIAGIGPEVCAHLRRRRPCPDHSGDFVRANCSDPRVVVIEHEQNQGVGGAVMSGYRAAIDDGASVIVKVDGDGQMDATLIPPSSHRSWPARPTTPRATASSTWSGSARCRRCACSATPCCPS
jgi:hypothetical protein